MVRCNGCKFSGIFSTLHSLPNDKVSCYDGYTKEFFIDAWSVVGSEFITAAQYFFLFGSLPTWINATIMSSDNEKVQTDSMM